MSQEFPPDNIPPGGTQLGERLGRMEAVLRSLERKVDILQPDQTPIEDSQESEDEASIDSETNENAPILRLFDYVVAVRTHVSLREVINIRRAVIGTSQTGRMALKGYQERPVRYHQYYLQNSRNFVTLLLRCCHSSVI